jgi:ketosteroid isomerase-like protein
MTSNHQKILAFVEALIAGDGAGVAPVLHEDVVWRPPASTLPTHRMKRGREVVANMIKGGENSPYVTETKTPEIQFVIADDHVAAAQFRMKATLRNGNAYDNRYCLFFRMRDGLIVEGWEHVDSAYFYARAGMTPDWLQVGEDAPTPEVIAQDLSDHADAKLAMDFVTALYKGDTAAQARMLNDDAAWHTPPSALPEYQRKLTRDEILKMSTPESSQYLPGTGATRLELSVAEDGMAAVQFRASARTRNGRPYDNHYALVFRCRDGRISEVWGHQDTAVFYATAGIQTDWLKAEAV